MDYSTAFRSAAARIARASGDMRARELAENLAHVHERIDRAVLEAGRADRPELIVVTKNFPAEDVVRLYELGIRDVGENRDQEAAPKAAQVAQLLEGADAESAGSLRWHFVGQLQSNKARSVVRYARTLHSADRPSLVKALQRAAAHREEQEAELDCLIQVDLGAVPDPRRGGANPADVPTLAQALADAPGLRPAGVMAVAPLEESAGTAFARLADVSARLCAEHPGAQAVSAGMSADLEEAVAAGATHLRIGRDVLGKRDYAR